MKFLIVDSSSPPLVQRTDAVLPDKPPPPLCGYEGYSPARSVISTKKEKNLFADAYALSPSVFGGKLIPTSESCTITRII